MAELLAPGRLLWRHMALSSMSDAEKALEQEARAYNEGVGRTQSMPLSAANTCLRYHQAVRA